MIDVHRSDFSRVVGHALSQRKPENVVLPGSGRHLFDVGCSLEAEGAFHMSLPILSHTTSGSEENLVLPLSAVQHVLYDRGPCRR
jgi:hypothetical protein